MSKYRLVGYSETREHGRLRVYIDADRPITAQSPVYVAGFTNGFDYDGQPKGLRVASSGLAGRVRAHLLGLDIHSYVATIPFDPLPYFPGHIPPVS